jgi:NADPH:quinone reductase-like Zn-dependent oxidoreductase
MESGSHLFAGLPQGRFGRGGHAGQLARFVALIDSGELRVDVARRVPLAKLAAVHTQAAAGGLHGKTVIVAPTA